MSQDEVFEQLRDGRALNPFDREVLHTVAGLVLALRAARGVLARDGVVLEAEGPPSEHPAVNVVKKLNAELRGWVSQRPDLFGEQKLNEDGREPFRLVK